ncbi:MAG: hypothetical protein CL799_10705 [Chromatiales bacterium]|jgi:TRAP-type C4-dicarboxylate transport system permease large subunit|nr:hypothetical protein [Chromatiales bacterium]
MKGQAKALIPALIGIITLLLTGITGGISTPGEQQAINIAETRAVTIEQYRNQELGAAFRMEADAAARQTGLSIAADLAVTLKGNAAPTLAAAKSVHRDKG